MFLSHQILSVTLPRNFLSFLLIWLETYYLRNYLRKGALGKLFEKK